MTNLKIKKLGHLMIYVKDLAIMLNFYQNILQFNVGEKVDIYIFLALGNEDHHELAFVVDQNKTNSFDHLAFEVESEDMLNNFKNKLNDSKIPYEEYDYGIGHCIYFDDPEGNCLELFVDLRKERNQKDWKGEFKKLN